MMLLISPRQGAEVAAAEYRDFCVAAGLNEDELAQRMLDHEEAEIGDLSGIDGVFVGGSSLNVTNAVYSEWQKQVHAQLKALIDSPMPTFLVCYGNTLVAGLYGGSVGRNHPEDSGETIIELTDAGRSDPLMRGFPERFSSLTGHTENVISAAPESIVLATGPSCPIQMVRANASTWACQFHADMDAHAMKTRMDFNGTMAISRPPIMSGLLLGCRRWTPPGATDYWLILWPTAALLPPPGVSNTSGSKSQNL